LESYGRAWSELRNKQSIRGEERQQQEFEERQEKDLADFKEMPFKVTRWRKANNLRDYINTVEEKASNDSGIILEIKDWLIWARKKANWYAPFIESEDELLNNIDKDILFIPKRNIYYGYERDDS